MQELESHFESVFDPKESLQTWRKKSWDRLSELGLPRQTQEAFQYLPLKNLEIPQPALPPQSEETAGSSPLSLIFKDGFFQTAYLPQPLVCLKLDTALLVYGVFLQNRFNRSLKEETDSFAAMNGVFQGKGAFLYVPPETKLEQPIEIHHYFTTKEMSSPRIQIFLGKNASVQIVQRRHAAGSFFSNAYIDASLDAGATLFFGDLEKPSPDSISFQSFRSTLKQNSRLHYLSVSHGAKLSRSSIKVQLLEPQAEARLQGLSQLDANAQNHTHVLVEHTAPNCRSRQHFKGILRGKSRSSFEGKILVRPEAQKTEAYQLNNTLLLSDDCIGFAKPNLEIFADDVKASHGATVTQLNAEELFYFRSRGLPLALAEEILAAGFCNEILNDLPSGIAL